MHCTILKKASDQSNAFAAVKEQMVIAQCAGKPLMLALTLQKSIYGLNLWSQTIALWGIGVKRADLKDSWANAAQHLRP